MRTESPNDPIYMAYEQASNQFKDSSNDLTKANREYAKQTFALEAFGIITAALGLWALRKHGDSGNISNLSKAAFVSGAVLTGISAIQQHKAMKDVYTASKAHIIDDANLQIIENIRNNRVN